MKAWPVLLAALSLSTSAYAVTQPNGTVIPTAPGCDGGKPTGLAAVFSCECDQPGVCNIGDPCPTETTCSNGQNATCESTMWHDFNDNTCIPSNLSGLDPQADAKLTPEAFRPTCPLTFKIVSRGTALFKDIFGWYNVTGTKPTVDELHPMLDCNKVTGDHVELNIQSEPAYLGGEVGFFLATPESQQGSNCANGDCCATLDRIKSGEGNVFYSQREYNPDASGASSLIHLLVYDSKVWQQKFYFAWEDIYGGSNNDFTDLVTSVEGIECSGGGVACTTGKDGICAGGVTTCDDQGNLICTGVFDSEAEACDAVDNDCDGEIDEDATCPTDEVCHNGRCVKSCKSGEFPCQDALLVCDFDTGLCVPADCKDITCASDEVCRAGKCVTPCDGVTCPWGQTCFGDTCIDPCDGVSCPTGQICRGGACFDGCAQCSGAACEAPLRCDTDTGDCFDPSCEPACADGTHCSNGSCVDNCAGVVCPGGVACENGYCSGSEPAGDGGVNPVEGGTDGSTGGYGGNPPADGGTDPEGGPQSVYDGAEPDSGCGCRQAGTSNVAGGLVLGLLGLAMAFARRRR